VKNVIGLGVIVSILFFCLNIPCYPDENEFEFFYPGERRDYKEIIFYNSRNLNKDLTYVYLNNLIETSNNCNVAKKIEKETEENLKKGKLDKEASEHLYKSIDYLGNRKFEREVLDHGHVDNGDIDKQIEEFNKAIEIDPDYANTYKYRAKCFVKKCMAEEALSYLTKGIELDPDNHTLYEERALIYTRVKHLKAALSDYDKAIELKSPRAFNYYNRGCIYGMFMKYEKAIPDFTKAIELSRISSKAFARMRLNSTISRHTEWAIGYSPYHISPFRSYYLRGFVYLQTGKVKLAIKDFKAATEWEPQFAKSYFYLGQIERDKDNLREAIYYYSKSIDVDNSNAKYYINRGYVYDLRGKKEKACFDFKKACDLGDCEMFEKAKKDGECE